MKDITPGRMSNAEVVQYWRDNGVFASWPQHEEIGEGKKYADSTEYVQAMRARAEVTEKSEGINSSRCK